MSIHKKELAAFGHVLFWTAFVIFVRVFYTLCFHTPLHYGFHNLCDELHELLLQKRQSSRPRLFQDWTLRGAWWAAAVIHKKTSLDKSCLFRHITSQIPFTTKLHEASASTMNKPATRFFRIPLGETLTKTEHFLQ